MKEKDIVMLREGGKKLAHVMEHVLSFITPSISAFELDRIAEEAIRNEGGTSWFKRYRDAFQGHTIMYPASICVSINDEIVHGIPRKEKIIREGDIVGIDIGMKYKNLYTDMARTVIAGNGDEKAKKLVSVTKEALQRGISVIRDGAYVGDIGSAIEEYVAPFGYGIVRNLVGHGIGYAAHQEPQIPNFRPKGKTPVLKAGMAFAIEPMITEKGEDTVTDADGWTIRTKDASRAAHFEDTVLVTKNGAEILTRE